MNERNRKQMEWLIGAVTVIGLAVSFIAFIWRVQNQTSVWLNRYQAHKEAGLADENS